MKTLLAVMLIAGVAFAQDGTRVIKKSGSQERQREGGGFQVYGGGSTLLDMVDGTGGGWSMGMKVPGKMVQPAGDSMQVERPAGGGMGVVPNRGGNRYGATLLDLVDR